MLWTRLNTKKQFFFVLISRNRNIFQTELLNNTLFLFYAAEIPSSSNTFFVYFSSNYNLYKSNILFYIVFIEELNQIDRMSIPDFITEKIDKLID